MKLIELIHTLEDRLADMGDVDVLIDNGTSQYQDITNVWCHFETETKGQFAVIAYD